MATIAHRIRQAQRLWRIEGASGLAYRVRARAANRLMPAGTKRLVVDREDFINAAEIARNGWTLPGPAPWHRGEALTIAWVCTPPAPGSGGHTTMFRIVSELEKAGHHCVIYLQDQHGWSIDQHKQAIAQWWPWVHADIRDLAEGIADCQAIFATGWGTAYAVLRSKAQGVRCYFVQDFEPAFAPAGSEYLLAEASYRFGFYGVTAGAWLSRLLTDKYGMDADSFDFGCDLGVYALDQSFDADRYRTGVAYYCRPSTPRRAHELAIFALDLFARAHPEVDIHLYGEPTGPLPFRAHHHGLLSPRELSALYNRCVAGLVLSATNVSLVPLEMLAAGCIPVVNDAEQNRMVLDNPNVEYVPATPYDLADALSKFVGRSVAERKSAAESAATSVKSTSWEHAGRMVETTLKRLVTERM